MAIERFLDLLRCPISREPLTLDGTDLVTNGRAHRYTINDDGIPLFVGAGLSSEADTQRQHYNKVAAAYTANLSYAHTREYLAYLDRVLLATVGNQNLGATVELCCGRGEVPPLLAQSIDRYVGIDVSENMLQAAAREHDLKNGLFLQADATRTPLADASFDTVFMLGGIHHVPARAELFAEIARILKPGGRFYFREPVSDIFLWRGLRSLIYRFSPMLNHETERPLRYEETVPVLRAAGLRPSHYRTHGLFGFCLFMNSDVLMFNRLFRFVPGIRAITRLSAGLDEALLRLPGMERAGLQVIGVAEKPA